MAHIIADRVRETTTTTGTGTLSLSAVTGFRRFSAVGAADDTAFYAVSSEGSSEWEVGLGTIGASNTLARTTVLASSNAGALVSFSAGTKQVFLTDPAATRVPAARPKRSGTTYYDAPGVDLRTQGTSTVEGNYIHYALITVGAGGLLLSELAFRVSTAAGSGHTARLAVYRADADAQPAALLWGTTGIPIDTTGKKTASPSLFLLPGHYLIAIWPTANVTVRVWRGGTMIRNDLNDWDLARTLKRYRDSASFATWSDPGLAWDVVDNTSEGFDHYVLCAI